MFIPISDHRFVDPIDLHHLWLDNVAEWFCGYYTGNSLSATAPNKKIAKRNTYYCMRWMEQSDICHLLSCVTELLFDRTIRR